MADTALLTKIKNGLGITGTYQDATLQVYIDEVKAFMKSAGVSDSVIESDVSAGCIMRGVADLWNYGDGSTKLSEYFRMRVLQLRAINPDEKTEHDKPVKIAPFLYKMKYESLDYDAGTSFFDKYRPTLGACSAVSNGNIFGRNYDWNYDNHCTIVIKTARTENRHATLCVSVAPSELTAEILESSQGNALYKIVPFLTVDGINDAGLVCEINVVSTGDKGITYGTNQDGEDLFAVMIPRLVLDYADDVDGAIDLLRSRNIFCANTDDVKQEYHFMLSDGTKTAVVEFVENEMTVIESFVGEKPIMTNFYLDGYDGTHESLTRYAMGIERHAILSDGFNDADSENEMIDLLSKAKYTKMYDRSTSPFWYSEYTGNYGDSWGDLTKDSSPEEYAPLVNHMIDDVFAHRKRDGKTWHTVSTSVYNIEDRKLILSTQEQKTRFTFHLTSE